MLSEFLVGGGKRGDRNHERQIGGSELLKDSSVVQCHKDQIVKSWANAVDGGGGRRGHKVGPAKGFAPP